MPNIKTNVSYLTKVTISQITTIAWW